jgi:protein subunit release factor A
LESKEYIDLRKLNRGELKQIRRQVVRLKKMGKTGKEIEELTGVQQNRASEIWTAYQREGERSMESKKRGFQKGTHLLLAPEEQAEMRETIITRRPEEFGIPGSLWTLKKVCAYVWKRYRKKISDGSVSDYYFRA